MGNLDKALQEFLKSDKFKKETSKKLQIGDFKFNGVKIDIYKEAERMRNILREEISDIKSTTTGLAFLDHINIDKSVKVIKENGIERLTIGISFDDSYGDEGVHRYSLWPQQYPDGAYLPYLFNNGYNAKNNVYGEDRHGRYIVSLSIRGKNNFMQRALDRFNAESPIGVYAEINKNYDGGTFDDNYRYY